MSLLRLGVEMKIIKGIDSTLINKIMIETKHNHMKKKFGEKLHEKNEDALRANLVRGFLQNI